MLTFNVQMPSITVCAGHNFGEKVIPACVTIDCVLKTLDCISLLMDNKTKCKFRERYAGGLVEIFEILCNMICSLLISALGTNT